MAVYALVSYGVVRAPRVDHGTTCTSGTPRTGHPLSTSTAAANDTGGGVGDGPGLTSGCTRGQTGQARHLAR